MNDTWKRNDGRWKLEIKSQNYLEYMTLKYNVTIYEHDVAIEMNNIWLIE